MSPTTVTVILTVQALVVAVILAALAAAAAGCLARADGATRAATLTRAGAAFDATLTLLALLTATIAEFLVRPTAPPGGDSFLRQASVLADRVAHGRTGTPRSAPAGPAAPGL